MKHFEKDEPKKILVVDDDQSVRNLIVDALELYGTYDAREVDNGISAIDYLHDQSCDLVISDHRMPGMSGLDLLNNIKDIKPFLPVIIMTAYPSIDLSVTAMKDGAVDFISKPFKIDDLLFKVNLYLKEQTFHDGKRELAATDAQRLDKKIRTLSAISCFDDIIDKYGGGNENVFHELVSLSLKITAGDYSILTLFDEEHNTFYPKIVKTAPGFHLNDLTGEVIIEALEPILRDVIDSRNPLLIPTSTTSSLYESIMCLPLMIRDKIFGFLSLLHTTQKNVFNQNDLTYVRNLVKRASLNIENALLYESLFASIMDTFTSLVHSIHVRDQYTERHSLSVRNFALRIATEIQCSDSDMESLKVAATLHDIGKIAIPDNILLKPGRLTDEEYEIIKTHPVIGEEILTSISLLDTERIIIRHHHERWDGRGYPDGLSGTDIPFLSRILAIADTFDAMTSDRPYRKGLPIPQAISEITDNANRQFDPSVVEAFLSVFSR